MTRKSGINETIGGFVGYNSQGQVINCYSTGRVVYTNVDDPTDKGFAGGVVTTGDYEMSGNFWDTQTSQQSSTAGNATGKSTTEMKQQATFDPPWDFNNTWQIESNTAISYPYLTENPEQPAPGLMLLQTVNFPELPVKTYGDAEFDLEATSSSGLPVTFVIIEGDAAVITGNTVTIKRAGSVVIAAFQEGDSQYAPSDTVQNILTVNKAELTIGGSFTVEDKEYDGTVTAIISENNLLLIDPLNDDDVTLGLVEAEFADSEIANDILVSIVSAQLEGEDSDNYTLSLEGAPVTTASITIPVSVDHNLLGDLGIYPNPFREKIVVENATNVKQVVITTAAGRLFTRIDHDRSSTITIPAAGMERGPWLVIIYGFNGEVKVKVMIRQ